MTPETISTASINGTPAPISVLKVLAIIAAADFTVSFLKSGSFKVILPNTCFPRFVPAKYLIPIAIAMTIGIIINQ